MCWRRTVAVLALVLGAVACGGDDPSPSPTPAPTAQGGTLRVAAPEPTGFNRMTSKNTGAATGNIVESIFFYASKAAPDSTLVYPGLQGPPTLVSQSPQVVEWKVHRDARWSDGTPVTSEDLRFFQEQVTNRDRDVAVREGYEDIEKFEVVDAKTVRATFKAPYPDFRGLFNDVPNAAFVKAQAGGWDTGLRENPGPSAGPFVFKSWVKGESLTLERNPQWWGPGRPLDSIVFRFLANPAAQVQALQNDEVDMIAPAAQRDLVDQANQIAGVRVDIGAGPLWEHLTFNTRNPILADVRVRQAIARAVDRKAIVDTLVRPFYTRATPLGNFIYMTNQPEYEAHDRDYQAVDKVAAGRLLDDAGWRLGTGDVRVKDGQKLSLRLSTTSANPVREEAQELIRRQLAAVGVETRVDNCAGTCLTNMRAPQGDFDIALFSWRGSPFPIANIKAIYDTGADANFGKYSSTAFDELAKQATTALDPAAQRRLANQLDQLLWKELPALPLFQRPTFLAVRTKFEGITNNATTDGLFWNAHEFAVKAGAS